MGRYCKLCVGSRPNEAFSGKGHRIHICKECARLPQEERAVILQMDEIFHYLKQSHISDKNVTRLKTLATSPNTAVSAHAQIVLQVAQVKPYKRRRLSFLASHHADLLEILRRTGLILAHGGAFEAPPDDDAEDHDSDMPF